MRRISWLYPLEIKVEIKYLKHLLCDNMTIVKSLNYMYFEMYIIYPIGYMVSVDISNIC